LSLTNKEKRRSKDLREKPAVGGIFKSTKKKKIKEKKTWELGFPQGGVKSPRSTAWSSNMGLAT
jgi:hypothetical protein